MSLPENFITYHPVPPEAAVWGVAVVGAGRAVVGSHSSYPPPGHGDDHTLTWRNGRVLGAYQLVFISAGRGEFESEASGHRAVSAPAVIMLFPGEWHRYRPDVETGWTEGWVELVGPSVDRLAAAGVFAPRDPVVSLREVEAFRVALESLQLRLGRAPPGFDAEAGAMGLQLLARLADERRGRPAASPRDAAIARAERLLVETLHDPPPMPEVAAAVGMAYSYFRREFKQRTGFSPRNYLQRLRLEKARRLLGTTAEPLKAIADRLGFNSPFHFSSAFKREFGVAPQHWRQAMRRRGGADADT